MRNVLNLVLVLGGCVESPTLGPAGLLVHRAETINPVSQPAQGEAEIIVLAVGADGTLRPGADCTAESVHARAAFPAPARLLVPHFGAASPVFAITCRDTGGQGTIQVTPRMAGARGFGGWPAVGISVNSGGGMGVGVGWQGGSAATGVALVIYPEARVVLE